MSRRKLCFNLLISSPSDVIKERNIVESLCNSWNSNYGEEKNVFIDVKRWEEHLKIDSRKSTQELINLQLVDKCDILFAIFGKRFGTATKNFESGTIEEVEQVIQTGRPYFIYFMNHQYLIDELQPSQIQKIKRFKNKLKKGGSYKEIPNEDSLRKNFLDDISYHVNLLLTDSSDQISENSTKPTVHPSEDSKENWYEQSISELINEHLENNNQRIAVYKRGITFNENCILWRSISEVNYPALIDCAKTARKHAFNLKYGNYEYEKDLRSRYNNWYDPILNVIKEKLASEQKVKVIGVASNYGLELNEIFSNDQISGNYQLEVLDLSTSAINKGRRTFANMKFFEGSMEDNLLPTSNYDVYLNLRSIHSRGVDFRLALSECHRILKPGGIAIISVSNGYLTPKKPGSNEVFEVQGLYDNRTETFSKYRPFELARKISSKLLDYGFKNPMFITGKTEVFVIVEK